jgi:hypothetical protein
MSIRAILPAAGRDLRLDLFRGIANWWIFLDHIPNNVVNWLTIRNYGFSDAADLFVFISGYTASFVYAKVMLDRGFVPGASKLVKRVWQLYVAHVLLFLVFIAAVGLAAQRWNQPEIINELNVAGVIDNPIQTVFEGLILKFKPVNFDVLPLYIVLMGVFPAVLWCMLRKPDLVMIGSIVLWLAARQFGWNLPSYPSGHWYFNPFCWQVTFMFGAWFALGGAIESRSIIRSPWLIIFGGAYLLFALVMTFAGRFPDFGHAVFPDWLFNAFNPNDKTNLAPYRLIHFVVFAFMITRFVPRDWPGLEWDVFKPFVVCGQHSLEVFCSGVFLAFVGHFVLILHPGYLMQIAVSIVGILLLCAVAYFKQWAAELNKTPPRLQEDGQTPLRQAGPSILNRAAARSPVV